LATLLESFSQGDDLLPDLMTLARSRLRTSQRLRARTLGELTHDALIRYVERQQWSAHLQRAVLSLRLHEMAALADGLEADDWPNVRRLIALRPNEEL
jgi:hypothetical protein